MANAATFVSTPRLGLVQILPADTTSFKSVFVAGSAGSKIVGLIVTSTDTATRIIIASVLRSAVNYSLCSVTAAITAGTDGLTASSNLFDGLDPGQPVDNDGQPYLFLQSGDTLQVNCTTTVTTAKVISVFAIGGDF